MPQPSGSGAPTLLLVNDNSDGTVSFVFDRTIAGVDDASGFQVNGEDGASATFFASTVVVAFPSAPFPGHVPYSVAAFADVTFTPPGTPAYPLVGTTT